MREFPLDAAARYLEETGKKTLSVARTPYVPESLSPKGCELTRGRSIFFREKTSMSWSTRGHLPTRETCVRKGLIRARLNVR